MDKGHINLCSTEIINTTAAGNYLCGIVMPWYNNGHILDYVRQQPFKLVDKLALTIDIASGLKYLHSIGLVHGNMCPENILVTDCGRACIADVGVNALIVREICKWFCPIPSAWAYKAPEELMSGIRNRSTDVYSFACTIYAASNFHHVTFDLTLILFNSNIDVRCGPAFATLATSRIPVFSRTRTDR